MPDVVDQDLTILDQLQFDIEVLWWQASILELRAGPTMALSISPNIGSDTRFRRNFFLVGILILRPGEMVGKTGRV